MIYVGKPTAVVRGQSDPGIFQRKNQALEIKRNSFEQATVDLFLAVPVMLVAHHRGVLISFVPTRALFLLVSSIFFTLEQAPLVPREQLSPNVGVCVLLDPVYPHAADNLLLPRSVV